MSKVRLFLPFLVALGLPAISFAQDSSRPYNYKPSALRFTYGEFELDGGSVYWRTRERDFFGSVADFDDDRFGLEYMRMATERWGYLFNGHWFDGRQTTSFRDYVDFDGSEIEHTTDLEVFDVGAGFVFYPLRRNAVLAPYLAGGMSLVTYDLTESGDFIDFDRDDLPIFSGTFNDTGSTIGWFWMLGVEVPIGSSFALYGQYSWVWANAKLANDFQGFGDLDLGGEELAVGVSYRF